MPAARSHPPDAEPWEVRSRRDLRTFIDLPFRLYASDPVWVAPLRHEMHSALSRVRNPFFDHAEAAYFLVAREGRAVGRIAAISNQLHNQTHGDRVGFFGFFESIDDPRVAHALLETAAAWCRGRGHDTLRGPMSFSVNDECGLLVDNFTDYPTLMSPYNPPWYRDLLTAAGLRAVMDFVVYQVDLKHHPERLTRTAEALARRTGVHVRPANERDFKREVARVKELYNRAWERNWGFVPLTEREIDHLARRFRPVAMPELIQFAEKDGEPVGFALMLPDLNQALRSNRSGRLLPGALRILWTLHTGRFRRARTVLMGILPEHRGRGIEALLIHHQWNEARKRGIEWVEAGWILETNRAMNQALLKMDFDPYRRYRVYERPL